MTVKRVRLQDFGKVLRRDLRGLTRKIVKAAHKTAEKGVAVARKNAPKAFELLADGIVAIPSEHGATVRSTAPYSGPVEEGSRPHMPPVEPIAAWVRLRGMQGITASGRITRKAGAPQAIARMLRATGSRRAVPIDAAEQIAWGIAIKISREGTEPTWFMKNALPEVEILLDAYIQRALRERVD